MCLFLSCYFSDFSFYLWIQHLYEILGAYVGLFFEYKKTFNSNDIKFTLYNVKGKNGEGYYEEKGPIIKLIRFLLLFLIEIVFFKSIVSCVISFNKIEKSIMPEREQFEYII